jgi:hypothetical protein
MLELSAGYPDSLTATVFCVGCETALASVLDH